MKWFRRSGKEADRKAAPNGVAAEVTNPAPAVTENSLRAQLESIDAGLNPFGFQQLCEKIGDERDATTVPLLIDLLGRSGREGLAPTNRKAAIQALDQIGDPAAVDILVDELETTPYYAAAALGRLGDRRAVEPLIAILQHGDWLVRSAAAEALGKIGDPGAGDALRDLVNDDRAEVRRAAEVALSKIGDSGIGWYLETTDTKQVGDHLIALGILDAATVSKMFSLGTYRLVAPADEPGSPRTVTLADTQFGDGVCGDPFVVDRIVLTLGQSGERGVAEINCPKCGAFFELHGVTHDDGQTEAETWLITNLVSIPERFAQSPYLGWPQIDHTTVEVEAAADSPPGDIEEWEVVEAGTERSELVAGGQLGADNIGDFNIYRIKPPTGANLESGDAVVLNGVELCGVCRYEVPLDAVVIGLKGFFDFPSKHSIACPRCNASALVVGSTTTSGSGTSRYWLMATQETGAPGVGVRPDGGRPELRISRIERASRA